MYCIRLEERDNVILETQENTIYCLEEKKQELEDPKERS